MIKSLILFSKDEPYWRSSRLIRKKILELWSSPEGTPEVFQTDFSNPDFKALKGMRFDRIIFCESYPHPAQLLRAPLPFRYEEVIFHVYGNFTQLLPEWLELFRTLKGTKISLVVSSHAEEELICGLLGEQARNIIHVIPYPLYLSGSVKCFGPLQKGKGEKWIVYAGRLSVQKNLGVLIDCFERFCSRYPEGHGGLKLILAGEFDSVGFPLHSPLEPGSMFQAFHRRLEKLPAKLRKRIVLMGYLNQGQLESLLSQANVTVSLSTFHDEDFGFAVLQALAQGSPALLTKWGGHTDFVKLFPDQVLGLNVRLNDAGLSIKYQDFEAALNKLLIRKSTKDQRTSFKRKVRRLYSVAVLARQLSKIRSDLLALEVSPAVEDFSRKLLRFRATNAAVFSEISARDKLYKQVYSPFLGPRNDK